MRKYFKTFDNHSEYEAFTATTEFILPNVSFCRDNEDVVHYNPSIKVTSVTLDKGTLSLSEGDTDTLVATVLPNDASNKNVIWSSSDSTVASVDSNGAVSGVSVGNANITVTTIDGGFTAQCATSVKNYKVITYAASAKLSETTSTGDTQGLHTNSFSGTSGQKLTMVSHTFEDGVGTVTFNDTIKTVGDWAFYKCSGMTSCALPDSVTSIGSHAFQSCSGLTSIEIPDSVTSIGNQAFYNCRSITSITISDSVTSIGNSGFTYCISLTSIDIPNSVTSIGNNVFYYCRSLTSIDIPSGVTSIGEWAFSSCSGLTSCTIGSGVTSIGINAFFDCISLTSIVIPDSVTSIGNQAFYNCSGITSCTIGNGVTSIGEWTFENCSSLTSITSNATTAPSIGSNTFLSVHTGGTLYVPIGSSGYDVWMGTGNYYLGKYGWTKVEQ